MAEAFEFAAYAVVKFLAYSAWCRSVRLGAVRWGIGLAFGIVIFLAAGSIASDSALRMYLLIYTPVRAVEWAIMAFLIRRRRPMTALSVVLWCAGGILVSFATDLLSPDGIQGRFCVGRCLC